MSSTCGTLVSRMRSQPARAGQSTTAHTPCRGRQNDVVPPRHGTIANSGPGFHVSAEASRKFGREAPSTTTAGRYPNFHRMQRGATYQHVHRRVATSCGRLQTKFKDGQWDCPGENEQRLLDRQSNRRPILHSAPPALQRSAASQHSTVIPPPA